jgi:predicted ATP-grasp superfamily ATP-dependent carboligase
VLILLWGLPEEGPLAAVTAALREAGAEFAFIDQRRVLKTKIRVTAGEQVAGSVALDGLHVDLENVGAAYIRPYDSRLVSRVRAAKNALLAEVRASTVDDILLNWCDITPALVLNRPCHMASNGCKPYQSQLIRQFGFRVPETLITTTPSAAQEFQQQHEGVIYKSISGVRSRVTRLTPAHAERLHHIACCPTQFQEFLPGRDCRAHVVGPDVFACELECEADDYRYPGNYPLTIRSAALPQEIEERCLRLAHSLGLFVAGIDLRRTAEGEWYCFEVNPSPAFTFYQESTGQPIAAAIASLLISGARGCKSELQQARIETVPAMLGLDQSLPLVPASIWEE